LLIKTLSDKYSFDMTNPNVAFKINYPTDWQSNSYENLFVNVDMEKLERVLSNLLSNAIKYTSDGDYIELAFNLTEGQKDLMITVSDTGIGIDSENLPFIFDRSYMVSRARNTNNSSGLGLAIVKELVEHHGGRVWAESELGKGSRFCLALPIHY
jgi:signal transduction histidine kinase